MTYENDQPPYKSAEEAYAAIHKCIAYSIEIYLEDCDFEGAIKLASMMEELEGHIGRQTTAGELT